MGKKERKPSPFSINSLLRLACVLLTILFVVYFVKTRLDIVEMQEQLMAMEEQVELQRLKNKDAQLSLREDEDTLERAAREKLDYAPPDERVFVDIWRKLKCFGRNEFGIGRKCRGRQGCQSDELRGVCGSGGRGLWDDPHLRGSQHLCKGHWRLPEGRG